MTPHMSELTKLRAAVALRDTLLDTMRQAKETALTQLEAARQELAKVCRDTTAARQEAARERGLRTNTQEYLNAAREELVGLRKAMNDAGSLRVVALDRKVGELQKENEELAARCQATADAYDTDMARVHAYYKEKIKELDQLLQGRTAPPEPSPTAPVDLVSATTRDWGKGWFWVNS